MATPVPPEDGTNVAESAAAVPAVPAEPTVSPAAVPVQEVSTPDDGVPRAPPEYNNVAVASGRVKVFSVDVGPLNLAKPLPVECCWGR